MMNFLGVCIAVYLVGVAAQDYGVDSSFPMHYNTIRPDSVNPLGSQHRQNVYQNYLDGCVSYYGKDGDKCVWNEEDRLEMTLRQPKDMHNYTNAGYAKIKAPDEVTSMLREFWEEHKSEQTEESWPKANTYVNHWVVPTYMLPLEEHRSNALAELIRPILEAWTGQRLILTSVYGIRIYKEGAVLAPHVDRLPLVSSCIINVAQDVDEDWPVEVIGHDGKAVNVTSHPGDIILYESHSVIHGRPFALKGRYFANIFVHFEPIGYTQKHAQRGSYGTDLDEDELKYLEEQYQELVEEGEVEHEIDVGTPDYVDEAMESAWRQEYEYDPDFGNPKENDAETNSYSVVVDEALTPHAAAAKGQLDALKKMAEQDPSVLTKADENGWRPFHEAVRSGELNVVEFLVEQGADLNERTNQGQGGSPLFWAEQSLEKDSPVVLYLKKKGAKNVPPSAEGSSDDSEL